MKDKNGNIISKGDYIHVKDIPGCPEGNYLVYGIGTVNSIYITKDQIYQTIGISHSSKIEIVNSINNIIDKNNMTLVQKLATALKSEPEKSFIKSGITNVDGSFTTEGMTIFLGYLLRENGNDFKTSVVDILLEESK